MKARWLFGRIGMIAARRRTGVLLSCYALLTDVATGWHGMNFFFRGLLDDPAHLATALVLLGTLIRFRGSVPDARFGWTFLICSVAIDVDHVPAELGWGYLTNGTPRPYTHALWLPLVLTAAWAVARRRARRSGRPHPSTAEYVLSGAALGVAAHFLRDIATAPMSFWWPVTNKAVEVPYWWYVLALALFIALGPIGRRGAGNSDNALRRGMEDQPCQSRSLLSSRPPTT